MDITGREWLGKKNRFTTFLREEIHSLLRVHAETTGIPITRIVEDALLVYLAGNIIIQSVDGVVLGGESQVELAHEANARLKNVLSAASD